MLQSGKIIGVDKIHFGLHQFMPDRFPLWRGHVRRSPEAYPLTVGVCGGDDGLQFLTFFFRHGPIAHPCKIAFSVVADDGHELWRNTGTEVAHAPIHGGITDRLIFHQGAWAVAGNDYRNGACFYFISCEFSQYVLGIEVAAHAIPDT